MATDRRGEVTRRVAHCATPGAARLARAMRATVFARAVPRASARGTPARRVARSHATKSLSTSCVGATRATATTATTTRAGTATDARGRDAIAREVATATTATTVVRTCAAGAGAAALALLAPEHARAAAEVVADDAADGGFLQGLLLILFSEIGDKTFFIAVLLALQQDKKAVFAGTYGALAAMTVISVTLGQFLHQLDENLPFETSVPWDDFLAAGLLLFFGVQTIRSAEESKAEEEEEDAKEAVEGLGSTFNDEMALIATTAALVFGAEWGDKSFFATIALAAAADPGQVVGGALAGHFIATAGAVTIGDVIGDYISERVVAYAGGSLFILFAVGTLVDAFNK
jgi:putative Ca2+/H+ antiporter (TMEM165/GDT1 family)